MRFKEVRHHPPYILRKEKLASVFGVMLNSLLNIDPGSGCILDLKTENF
jgi:hypothetical protein